MIKAALFDLDGVVFNTEPQYTVFWGSQCREFHPELPGLEHEIKGQTLTQILDKLFSGELEDKRELVVARLDEFEKYPWLRDIRQRFEEQWHKDSRCNIKQYEKDGGCVRKTSRDE